MKKFTFIISLLLGLSIFLGSAKILATPAAKSMAQTNAAQAAPAALTKPETATAVESPAMPDPAVVSADQALLETETVAHAPVVEDSSDPSGYEYEYLDPKGGKEALPPIGEFTEAIYPRSGPIIPSTEYFALVGAPFSRSGNPPNTRGQDPCPAAP